LNFLAITPVLHIIFERSTQTAAGKPQSIENPVF